MIANSILSSIFFSLSSFCIVYYRSTMGICTSSVKRRQKQYRQRHKRSELKNSTVFDNKKPSPAPYTVLRNQRPHSLLTSLNVQSSSLIEPIVPRTETSSLIQFCSPNTNNSMSSSSTSHVPPRIPVPKSRLPIHQPQSSGSIRPKYIPATIGITNPTGNIVFKYLFVVNTMTLYTYPIYTSKKKESFSFVLV